MYDSLIDNGYHQNSDNKSGETVPKRLQQRWQWKWPPPKPAMSTELRPITSSSNNES